MTDWRAARLAIITATLLSCFAVKCPQKHLVCPNGTTCFNRTNLCKASTICLKYLWKDDKDSLFPLCVDSQELGLQGLVVCKDSNGHPERAIPPEMFCDEKFHCKNKADESSLLCPGNVEAVKTGACQNGGTPVYFQKCVCSEGFEGNNCEKAICHPACQHGQCVAHNKCNCTEGYTGDTCNIAICSQGCGTGGICISPNTCGCTDNRYGDKCQHMYNA